MALTLTNALNAADQTFLLSGSPAPTSGDFIQVGDEVMYIVGAGKENTPYRVEVTRGFNTSTPATHIQGATAYQVKAVMQTDALSAPPPSAAGGGSANFESASIVLTNAQIKLLASTGIEIVAAPGVGKAVVPVSATLYLDFAAGAYTPSAGTDYFTIGTGTDDAEEMLKIPIPNNAATLVAAVGPATHVAAGAGAHYADAIFQDMAQIGNAALTISISGGNPTGGNAANTMTVSVLYLVVP